MDLVRQVTERIAHQCAGKRDDIYQWYPTMTAMRARVFWSGRSQAVRLPKEFRFDSESVLIRREGNAVVLEPLHDWPEGYAESFAGMPSDVRRPPQGKPEKREPIT